MVAAMLAASEPKPVAAVVALGQCDAPSTAIFARSFRAALTAGLGSAVQTEQETAEAFGGLTTRTLAELSAAVASARHSFYADDTAGAGATLEAALKELARLPPSEARWSTERDLLTLLAQVRLKADRSGAEAALSRVYRVDAEYHPDETLYSPAFQRFAADVRNSVQTSPTALVDLMVSPPGREIYVGGKRMGTAPLSVRLPVGEYRVEVDWGRRGAVRTVQVPSGAAVELAASVEGAVAPEGGPCLEVSKDALLKRFAGPLKAGRIYAVRVDVQGTEQYASVSELDVATGKSRDARVKLEVGAPVSEALGLLAGYFSSGVAVPRVEIPGSAAMAAPAPAAAENTPGSSNPGATAKPPPVASPPVLSAAKKARLLQRLLASGPSDEGPEVKLLKDQVYVYEPIYAEVQHADRVGDATSTSVGFEYRRRGAVLWSACEYGLDDTDAQLDSPPSLLPAEDVRFRCQITAPGVFDVRYRGAPVTVTVARAPFEEKQVLAILEASPGGLPPPSAFHGQLASSLYAGYAMVGARAVSGAPSPTSLQAHWRELTTAIRGGGQQSAEAFAAMKQAQQAAELATLEYGVQLSIHPEFIFADSLRLKLVSALIEVGKCHEARDVLGDVTHGKELSTAKRFLRELDQVEREAPDSICRSVIYR